jgi:hypothetical protein
MPSYEVKSRVTHAATVETIEALHREDAVHQVVNAADPGDEVDVLTVTELPGTAGGGEGVTGATGGMFGVGETRSTKAQLNDMTKDELLSVAASEGAEVSEHWNKGDIIDAIVKHRKHA